MAEKHFRTFLLVFFVDFKYSVYDFKYHYAFCAIDCVIFHNSYISWLLN